MSYNKCVEEDVKTISYLLLSHCLCELLSLYCILSKMVAELGCIFFGASAFQYSYNCTCVHLVVWKWLIKNSECIVNLEQKLQNPLLRTKGYNTDVVLEFHLSFLHSAYCS